METIEMTVKEAVDAFDAISSITNQVVGTQKDGKPIYKKYPLDILWPLEDMRDALEVTHTRNQEQIVELAKQYGEPHPTRYGHYQVKPENIKVYTDKVKKLNETVISISFVPMHYEVLNDYGVVMDGQELRPLRKYFIKQGERDSKKKPKKAA
jgi:hypothetical protein